MPAATPGSVQLIEKELTEAIIGASIEVSNELGAGYLESVYEKALVVALGQRGLKVQEQAPLDVYFRGHLVGQFFADLLVEGRVIVELKAVKALSSDHEAQLLDYLKTTGIRVGLLVNFGKPRVEWKRLAY